MERIIAGLAPHLCLGCGEEGSVVCDWCQPDFATPLPDRCYKCKVQTESSLVCKKCRRESRLGHVWARTEYDARAKQLIHDFKFVRKQAAAKKIAQMMAETLPYLPPDTIITHIPTASRRVRQRGYDHAELLAAALSRELGLSRKKLLVRVTRTRQVGAKRAERIKQMENAFRAINDDDLRKSTVLLIDDLVTTGATLESAAKCLKTSGAKSISAAVFAHV